MSAEKYQKYQRSSKPKYVITDRDGKVVVASSNAKDYLKLRAKYLKQVKRNS